MPRNKRWIAFCGLVTWSLALAGNVPAQQSTDPHSVPVVDAELGPCSADFNVYDTNGKPVYSAQISVWVNYGHFHKMDLQVGTNIDGKALFSGLPTNPKSGLFFQAAEGDRSGTAFDDPAKTCKTHFDITLRKSPTNP